MILSVKQSVVGKIAPLLALSSLFIETTQAEEISVPPKKLEPASSIKSAGMPKVIIAPGTLTSEDLKKDYFESRATRIKFSCLRPQFEAGLEITRITCEIPSAGTAKVSYRVEPKQQGPLTISIFDPNGRLLLSAPAGEPTQDGIWKRILIGTEAAGTFKIEFTPVGIEGKKEIPADVVKQPGYQFPKIRSVNLNIGTPTFVSSVQKP